jgi:hypothetical protein
MRRPPAPQHSVLSSPPSRQGNEIHRMMHPLRRCRIAPQQPLRPNQSLHQIPAAVRADVAEEWPGALGAERALIRADSRLSGVGWQVPIAVFAARLEDQHSHIMRGRRRLRRTVSADRPQLVSRRQAGRPGRKPRSRRGRSSRRGWPGGTAGDTARHNRRDQRERSRS